MLAHNLSLFIISHFFGFAIYQYEYFEMVFFHNYSATFTKNEIGIYL